MEDTYTVEGLATLLGVELPPSAFKLLTENLIFLAKQRGDGIAKTRKRTSNALGKHQSYWVSAFPVSYLDSFEKMCMGLNLL